MTETDNKIDEYNEELRQDAASNFTENTPETTDSRALETFKIDKTSNVPNTKTHQKKTQNRKHKIVSL